MVPLKLTFGGLGNFGSQIVFINLTNDKQLEILRQDMNNLLKEEGIHIADQRFTPHVTLFRSIHRNGGRSSMINGCASELTVEDMVKRSDLLPVSSSPVREIVFRKLQGKAS